MKLEVLQKAMIAALKEHNKERKEAISGLVAAVKKVAIDNGCRDDIPEEMVDQTILKELKSVKEQIDTCPESRTDLRSVYEFQYAVLQEFAPKLLSEEEIKSLLKEKYSEVIATKNKGMIMKSVMAELKGKADGKVIGKIVDELMK